MSNYLFYTDKPETLLDNGFKDNGYAFEHESVSEFGTPKLTIHFEKQKGIILFNYCAPVTVDASQILNFFLETRNEDDDFFYKKTKFGDIGRFRWHHKFGIISSEEWSAKIKQSKNIEAWFNEIDDLEGFTLSREVLALRYIVDNLKVLDIED
jgi:hypothetical protein